MDRWMESYQTDKLIAFRETPVLVPAVHHKPHTVLGLKPDFHYKKPLSNHAVVICHCLFLEKCGHPRVSDIDHPPHNLTSC